MKFQITVAKITDTDNSHSWVEDFNYDEVVDQKSAEQRAEEMIENYNETLYQGDTARKLLAVTFAGGVQSESHDWHKSNLMTVPSNGRHASHDIMRCEKCGITGKRYGLSGVTLDPAYRAKAFNHCDTARALLERRRNKHPSGKRGE